MINRVWVAHGTRYEDRGIPERIRVDQLYSLLMIQPSLAEIDAVLGRLRDEIGSRVRCSGSENGFYVYVWFRPESC